MKIVFTSKGKTWDSEIDPRFGRTEYFAVYEEEKDELTFVENSDSTKDAHGAGPKTAAKIAEIKPDVLITGNGPGGNAETALKTINLQVFVGASNKTIRQAYEAYKNNELKKII